MLSAVYLPLCTAIPQMYAGIITISAIGVAFNQFLVAVERRLSSWRVPADS